MDPDTLHFECTKMVQRTKFIISEVEEKLKKIHDDPNDEASANNEESNGLRNNGTNKNREKQSIDDSKKVQPLWIKCLILFCQPTLR